MSVEVPLSIRRAEIRDVRTIRDIDRESFPTPWTQGWTLAQVTDPARVHLVAERKFKVEAHGGLIFLGDRAHVATIAVAAKSRRQGIAKALMAALTSAAVRKGYTELTLEVRESNKAAIALYEGRGLEVVGRRVGYYGDNNEDAIIMTASNLGTHG